MHGLSKVDQGNQINLDKVRRFELKEENLAKLGLALRNKACRKIMIALVGKEMYVNQIARETALGVNIVSEQLKILRELNVVDVRQKPISKKTNDHNFYSLDQDIFIDTNPKKGKLEQIFKETVKITGFVIPAFVAWWIFPSNKTLQNLEEPPLFTGLELALIISVIGISTLYILKKIKKK